MPSSSLIRTIIWLYAGIMFVISVGTGGSLDENWFRWVGGVTSFVTLLVLAFDKWLWRAPGISKLTELRGTRVVRGTWSGVLEYKADAEGKPGKQQVFMAIEQTYSSISIRCYFPTKQSESYSLVAAINRESHRSLLRYVYQQQAEHDDRDQNRPTQGACDLRLVGRPVYEISGSYYAERGGKGKIKLLKHSPRVAGSAGDAQRLKYVSRAPKS